MLPDLSHFKPHISPEQVETCKKRFQSVVDSYKHGSDIENIVLKETHTKRVYQEIMFLGTELGLGEKQLCLAQITALFHDIGRFEQYARYQTFMDRQSENHAILGVKALKKLKGLNFLEKSLKSLVFRIILYHNRAVLPPKETPICLFFSKLLRDADKLDIWRVVTDYYCQKDRGRNKTIELDLPDTPGISKNVSKCLMNQTIVDINQISSLNDLKLLQIGWIFDLNFRPAFKAVQSRRYLEMIFEALPPSKEIRLISNMVFAYLEKQNLNNEHATVKP